MTTDEYCASVLKDYPEYISKEQMYRICHISKKTCSFLLEQGLVPNSDSGKLTRRFRIRTVDVVDYLQNREEHPEFYKAPPNYYKGKGNTHSYPLGKRLTEKDVALMREYYEQHLQDQPDVMSTPQVALFTGYCKSTVNEWCRKGYLKSFLIRTQFIIPKEYLLDFLIGWHFIGISVKSEKHHTYFLELRDLLSSLRKKQQHVK